MTAVDYSYSYIASGSFGRFRRNLLLDMQVFFCITNYMYLEMTLVLILLWTDNTCHSARSLYCHAGASYKVRWLVHVGFLYYDLCIVVVFLPLPQCCMHICNYISALSSSYKDDFGEVSMSSDLYLRTDIASYKP